MDERGCVLKIKGHATSTMQAYWRKAVLENCKYTCAVCGNKWPASELEAHHLVARHYRALRYSWKNGVAVCRGKCHSVADERSGTAAILRDWPHTQYLENMVRDFRTYKEYLNFCGITERVHTTGQLVELKDMAKKEVK